MKISDEIIGALSGLALLWSFGTMVKSQFIDKYDTQRQPDQPQRGLL
jgi:hypothetical protein